LNFSAIARAQLYLHAMPWLDLAPAPLSPHNDLRLQITVPCNGVDAKPQEAAIEVLLYYIDNTNDAKITPHPIG
jgi:hypothetical protein